MASSSLNLIRRLATSRSLTTSARLSASVSPPTLSEVLNGSHPTASLSSGQTPAQRARQANLSPQDRAREIELTRERKLKEYENRIRIKAMEKGLSIEELRAQALEQAAAKAQAKSDAAAAAAASKAASAPGEEAVQERDERVAREIRARAQAEAKRKLESGEYSSGMGGKGNIRPLSKILDLSKLETADAGKIGELWTGYHTLKGKLSAVLPAHLYEPMLVRGRKFPQFVLPLPRKITDETGASKQGYEMHLCEWAVLPPPPPLPFTSAASANDGKVVRPATVLFTPLAEYKLRQEFAQPMLVLTFYTDLAASKGIVLMRGEITAAEAAAAAPTGFAAAAAAAQRGASEEEQQKLLLPLQSEGKMSQSDAQLLIMSLQRYYMPVTPGAGDEEGARERMQLLESFHQDPASFSVEKLTKATFLLS